MKCRLLELSRNLCMKYFSEILTHIRIKVHIAYNLGTRTMKSYNFLVLYLFVIKLLIIFDPVIFFCNCFSSLPDK